MERTNLVETYWEKRGIAGKYYTSLESNNEANIIVWLSQQGFAFDGVSGVECHDIGEDYFSGATSTTDLNGILSFIKHLYGEWSISATYQGVKIQMNKVYPNITHGLSFQFPASSEALLQPLFQEFEKAFCYPELRTRKEYR